MLLRIRTTRKCGNSFFAQSACLTDTPVISGNLAALMTILKMNLAGKSCRDQPHVSPQKRKGRANIPKLHRKSSDGLAIGSADSAGGNPAELSIGKLAERIIALAGSSSRVEYGALPADDPMQRQPDIALARKLLNWSPTVELDDGLRRTTAYFRELLAA